MLLVAIAYRSQGGHDHQIISIP